MTPTDRDESDSAPGFSVRDRRRFNPDGTPKEDAEPASATEASPEAAPAKPAAPQSAPPKGAPGAAETEADANLPPLDFAGFVLSLAQTALIDLGAAAHPETGEVMRNLRQARQTIDILALLQDKTQGNLSTEEGRLLEGALYQLRLAFLEAKKKS